MRKILRNKITLIFSNYFCVFKTFSVRYEDIFTS